MVCGNPAAYVEVTLLIFGQALFRIIFDDLEHERGNFWEDCMHDWLIVHNSEYSNLIDLREMLLEV